MTRTQTSFILSSLASLVILVTVMHMNSLISLRDSRSLSKSHDEPSLEQQHEASVFNDMDFEAFEKEPLCGFSKCFFLSKSNNEFGYLVLHPVKFINGVKSYELAKRLEEEYQVDLGLFPPEMVPLSRSMAAKFSEYGKLKHKNHNRYENVNKISVQKMRRIPNDAVLVGCNKECFGHFLEKIPDFIKETPGDSFYQNMKSSFEQTKKMYFEHPQLLHDMQFMVDRFGKVHHMDFDRVLQPGAKKTGEWIDKCYGRMDKLVRMSHDLTLRKGTTTQTV